MEKYFPLALFLAKFSGITCLQVKKSHTPSNLLRQKELVEGGRGVLWNPRARSAISPPYGMGARSWEVSGKQRGTLCFSLSLPLTLLTHLLHLFPLHACDLFCFVKYLAHSDPLIQLATSLLQFEYLIISPGPSSKSSDNRIWLAKLESCSLQFSQWWPLRQVTCFIDFCFLRGRVWAADEQGVGTGEASVRKGNGLDLWCSMKYSKKWMPSVITEKTRNQGTKRRNIGANNEAADNEKTMDRNYWAQSYISCLFDSLIPTSLTLIPSLSKLNIM